MNIFMNRFLFDSGKIPLLISFNISFQMDGQLILISWHSSVKDIFCFLWFKALCFPNPGRLKSYLH